MTAQFVGEPLRPVLDGAQQLAPGSPIIPGAFEWRGQSYPVLEVIRSWKELSPCTHGATERYLRKHWYRIRTAGSLELTVYFLRQPQPGRRGSARWYLYTVDRLDDRDTRP